MAVRGGFASPQPPPSGNDAITLSRKPPSPPSHRQEEPGQWRSRDSLSVLDLLLPNASLLPLAHVPPSSLSGRQLEFGGPRNGKRVPSGPCQSEAWLLLPA